MFGTIRKHQQWLWIVIITLVSISLVVFFTDFERRERDVAGEFGSIQGRPIKRQDFLAARKEVLLSHFMRNGRWPGSEENADRSLQRETISRLFLLEKVKEFDIHVSDKAVARLTSERIGDYPYDRFEQEILAQADLKAEDFERFIRHEAAIQQMLGVAGLPGKFLKPQEVETLFRKEYEESLAELAVFWSSNYLDQVTVTPEQVAQHYTNRLAVYRVPERTQVSYVAFAASNYLAEADQRMNEITNLETHITDYYLKLGTNLFKDTNGVALSEAAAKAKIKEEMRLEYGLQFARRAAAEFGSELMDTKPDPNKAQNLDRLAAAKGLPVQVSPSFDRFSGLEDTDFPEQFQTKALNLTPSNPTLFNPILGSNVVYVIALKQRIPPEFPPLDKIRDKVTTDAKLDAAAALARKEGTNFHTLLTNGLAQGKGFDDLCAQAKVQTIKLPPISSGTSSLTNLDVRVDLQRLQGALADLKPGQAGNFVPALRQIEGGWIPYLRARQPVSELKVQEEFPKFLAQLRAYRQVEAHNRWFGKQAEAAQVMLPREPTNAPPRTAR